MLSQSGAFKVSDFQIRPEGGLMSTIDEAANISDHAHPAELSASSTDLALQAHALPVLMQVQRVAVANPRPQILLRAFFLVGGGLNRFRFRHAVGEPRVFDGGLRRRHGRQVVHLGFRGTSAYHQREPQGCTTKKFIHNNNIRFEF